MYVSIIILNYDMNKCMITNGIISKARHPHKKLRAIHVKNSIIIIISVFLYKFNFINKIRKQNNFNYIEFFSY